MLAAACSSFNEKEMLFIKNGESFHSYTDRIFQYELEKSPEWLTYKGDKKRYGELNDFSEEARTTAHKRKMFVLKNLDKVNQRNLDPNEKLSFDLYKDSLEMQKDNWKWRDHSYPINQLFGRQSSLPAFMINMHRIDNLKDAKAYISRIKAFEDNFEQISEYIEWQGDKGIVPPKFVFPKVKQNIQSLLSGYPVNEKEKEEHILLKDFKKKLSKIKIKLNVKTQLIDELKNALEDEFKTAYEDLLDTWNDLEEKATSEVGAWKLPSGNEFYKDRLRMFTTTNYHPEEIHTIGLKNVDRIHKDMKAIKNKLGFKGNLKDFFDYVRKNPKLYYPSNDKGRVKYLKTAKKVIRRMEKKLPQYFGRLPKADLEIKRVESFREKSSGGAFYNSPSADGSRPGIYYVNLYNMKEQPIYQIEALAYHEAVPGHHMQLTIAQENSDLPEFRKRGFYTAYTEGWALYAERLAKDMGFYKNLYSDFGRLSMELRRACRLVVDTGIHYKKWSREKAIKYLLKNTPDTKEDHVRSVERYIVNPGQATAYMIGMLKILELRKWAKNRLGEKFNIREFHDLVLTNGALPLSRLEREIKAWAKSKKSFRRGKQIITI